MWQRLLGQEITTLPFSTPFKRVTGAVCHLRVNEVSLCKGAAGGLRSPRRLQALSETSSVSNLSGPEASVYSQP